MSPAPTNQWFARTYDAGNHGAYHRDRFGWTNDPDNTGTPTEFRCDDPEGQWIQDQQEAHMSTDLEIREPPPPTAPASVGLFNTDDPDLVLARSAKVANLLKDVVNKAHLVLKIGQSEYIKVEGWTTLGALVGLFAQTEWTRPLAEDAGWEAAVVVRNAQGAEFGRAEAQCLRSEKNWKNRDDYALRSMAQTRAMGKALRMPLGFIATLAGYEATPAEEMPASQEADVPFEDGPAQGPDTPGPPAGGTSGTGRAAVRPGPWAHESDVTAFLELAAQLSPEAHDKAVTAVANHRVRFGGMVDPGWLDRQRKTLEKKLPADKPAAEPLFVPPAGAVKGPPDE
jgi:hypothetical protein